MSASLSLRIGIKEESSGERIARDEQHKDPVPDQSDIDKTAGKYVKIQVMINLVRKFLYASSKLGFESFLGSLYGIKAFLTTFSNLLSISACGSSYSRTSTDAPPSVSDFLVVWAEGRASALSAPLVPQETSCQLQKA